MNLEIWELGYHTGILSAFTMVLNFLSLQTIDKSGLQTTNMRKQLALLLTLIFLLNLVVVDNQDAELQNSQSSSNTMGSYSNYTMDIRTDLLDYNRAKYLTYLKTDYGIKTLNYDDYENAWYYREINNGTWYEQPIYYQADDYPDTESIKFVLTDFGIFQVNIRINGFCGSEIQTQICLI